MMFMNRLPLINRGISAIVLISKECWIMCLWFLHEFIYMNGKNLFIMRFLWKAFKSLFALVAEINRSLLFSKNVADWVQEEKAITSACNWQNILVGNIRDGLTMPLDRRCFVADSSVLLAGSIVIFSVSYCNKNISIYWCFDYLF